LRSPLSSAAAIGIDFGTTNSTLARVTATGQVELATFPFDGGLTDAYRSLLYVEQTKDLEQTNERIKSTVKSWTGPEGIERYLAAETKGRLIQSLKSFLSSRLLESTEVFGKRRTVEELIARVLQDLREHGERQFGIRINSAVVGRPVRFVGSANESDDAFAESRLRQAFALAGFDSVQFEMEPVAAAHYYESTLDHDELILIGDFGGGTSDFSLIRVGPGVRRRGRTPEDLLGNAGAGVAGDAFDAKIIRHFVSPALGVGTEMRSMHKVLPVPSWIYAQLERWHYLSFLRGRDVMNTLRSVRAQAIEPEKIEALIQMIDDDLGYQLHRAVQKVKCGLSAARTADFRFTAGSIDIQAKLDRRSFELWIAEELGKLAECVDSLLKNASVQRREVDMVFLTGGSSFVPAVRRIFTSRFGAERLRSGNEFTSVARGLALSAARRES
jgi:hypothetical chaperone protein